VVIRDTKLHDPLEGEVDMSPLDILQMLGRAGRPGYDDAGHAHVVCDGTDADRYRALLEDGKPIESRLAGELATHLNAEVALGVVDDIEDVMDWLETTFYYARAQSAPGEYDAGDSLRDRVSATLERLVDDGFVEQSGLAIEPTALGRLTSQYYLRLETATAFHRLCIGGADVDVPAGADDADGAGEPIDESAVLRTVADAAAFDSVSARRDERETFGPVLDGEGAALDAGNRKVLAILRAGMDGATPAELRSDAWVIRQNALRLLAALRAFCERFATPRAANLVRRTEARVEHGIAAEAVGLTAVEGVGSGRASKLAAEGLTTPAEVRRAGVGGLVDAGLTEGVAERVHEQATALPDLAFDWDGVPDTIAAGENAMAELTVRNRGDGAPAGIRVTVNGVEMSAEPRYLGTTTVPVGVFGGDADELTYRVTVSFADLPLPPVSDRRTVRVE
jgi:hypothetical protein